MESKDIQSVKLESYSVSVGITMAIIGVLMFSTKAVFVKLAYADGGEVIPVLMLRMLFSLPFFLGITVFDFVRNGFSGLSLKDSGSIVFLGFMGYYLASLFDFMGLVYIDASLERLVLFIYPTLVVLFSAIYFKRKPTKQQVWAIAVTYLGIILVFIQKIFTTNNQNVVLGATLIILCSIAYAIYLIGSGELIKKVGSNRFTNLAMLVATITVFIHNAGTSELGFFPHYKNTVYLYCALMAVISTVIPAYFLSAAIKRIGASNVSIIGSLGPVSTIGLAVLFLGEVLTLLQIFGALVVIGGVVFLNRKKD